MRAFVLVVALALSACGGPSPPPSAKVNEIRTHGVIVDMCQRNAVYKLNDELWIITNDWNARRVESVLAACRL